MLHETRERRRDRRVRVEGRATLRPDDGACPDGLDGLPLGGVLLGDVVDGSPLGLRIRLLPPARLHLGAAVEVDLEVREPGKPREAPPVRLRGRGIVVRSSARAHDDEGAEIALSLESPLAVRETFDLIPA